MTQNLSRKLDFSRKLLLSVSGLLAVAAPVSFGLLHATQARAQLQTVPQWQTEAGGKLAFEVASVKQNDSGSESSSMNVPIGPGDVYPPNGGLLSATNVPLISYIYFAYKLTGSEFQLLVPKLPKWILKDKFDIEARAAGNPTKDQMRLMMQSLLADRFKLAIHYETQQLPAFALVLAKPGKTGPQLQPHPDDSSCQAAFSPTSSASALEPSATVAGGLPATCGGIIGMPPSPSGRMRIVARNVPISLLANSLAQVGNLDRPVLDQSGLSGAFDFTFEWTPQHSIHPLPSGVNAPVGEPGPTFLEDLKAQLGLTLESQKGPVEVFVMDHVEKPAESQAQSTTPIVPAFETASIKPNNGTPMAGFSIVGKPFAGIMWKADRFMATNYTLHKLIQRAYDVQDDQILGGPDWLNSEGYDIDAKVESSVVDELQRLGPDQRILQSRRMLQALLADRFKLSFHSETKEVPVYVLVVAGNGLKIQRAIPGDTYPNGFKRPDGAPVGAGDWSQPGKFVGQGVPIATLVQDISEHYLHRTVLDKTGLTDKYDFTLQWIPVESQAAIFAAIQEQLGLKLESQKGPAEVLVINHVEKPSEN